MIRIVLWKAIVLYIIKFSYFIHSILSIYIFQFSLISESPPPNSSRRKLANKTFYPSHRVSDLCVIGEIELKIFYVRKENVEKKGFQRPTRFRRPTRSVWHLANLFADAFDTSNKGRPTLISITVEIRGRWFVRSNDAKGKEFKKISPARQADWPRRSTVPPIKCLVNSVHVRRSFLLVPLGYLASLFFLFL